MTYGGCVATLRSRMVLTACTNRAKTYSRSQVPCSVAGGVTNDRLRPQYLWAVAGGPLPRVESWFVWSTTFAS